MANGLSGRSGSTSRECTIWVFWTNKASRIAMPMLLPMLRIKLKMAVPWVSTERGKVEKLIVLSGTKTNPSPKP